MWLPACLLDVAITMADGLPRLPPANSSPKQEPGLCQQAVLAEIRGAWSLADNLRGIIDRPSGALECLDGLRALAVLWVIAYHSATTWHWTLDPEIGGPSPAFYSLWAMQIPLHGEYGVDIFFVLSGFLISLQAMKELEKTGRINYGGFLWARFWRIAPAFYVSIAIHLLLPGFSEMCRKNWWELVLFLVGILPPKGCMVWTWSISMEFQFYFITPIVVRLACTESGEPRRHCFKILGGLSLLCQAMRIILYYIYFEIEGSEHKAIDGITNKMWTRAHAYFFGITACVAYRIGLFRLKHHEEVIAQTMRCQALSLVDIFASLLVCFLAVIAGNGTSDGMIVEFFTRPQPALMLILVSQCLFALGMSWLVFRICTKELRILGAILSHRFWVPIARLSYGAYLLQFISIMYVGHVGPWPHWKVLTMPDTTMCFVSYVGFYFAVALLTFFWALVLHLCVEAPCLKLRKVCTPGWLTREGARPTGSD